MLKEEEISERLTGKSILIIEDDESLSKRLVNVFKRFGVVVDIRYCVDSGLEVLKRNGLNYDLIVVDVMLPRTEDEFRQIQRCRSEEKECIKVLMQEDEDDLDDEELAKKLEDTRKQRASLLKRIVSLITDRGGIEMVDKWLSELMDKEKKRRPAIFYLTAVGNEDMNSEGKRVVGDERVEWIVKPVTGTKIIQTAAHLLK